MSNLPPSDVPALLTPEQWRDRYRQAREIDRAERERFFVHFRANLSLYAVRAFFALLKNGFIGVALGLFFLGMALPVFLQDIAALVSSCPR